MLRTIGVLPLAARSRRLAVRVLRGPKLGTDWAIELAALRAPIGALVVAALSDAQNPHAVRDGLELPYRTCVTGIGDADGDGAPDLAVIDRDGIVSTSLWILSGRHGGTIAEIPAVPGSAFAAALDCDRDGFPDIAVTGGGRVTVFSACDGRIVATYSAEGTGDSFGSAVGGGGDVDADGWPDLVVGEPRAPEGGRAWVVSGFSSRTWLELRGPTHFGSSVGFLPDIDGDGGSEVLVGAPRSVVDAGREHSLHGFVSVRSSFDGWERGLAVAHAGREQEWPVVALGDAVVAIGDVDGDGGADFAASSIDELVQVSSGRTGTSIHEIDFRGAYLSAEGTTLDRLGDVDGDGAPDYAIGANEFLEPFVVTNPSFFEEGLADIRSGRTGKSIASTSDEGRGIDVSGIGDVDGDGRCELLVAYPASRYPQDHPRAVELLGARDLRSHWRVRFDELRTRDR